MATKKKSRKEAPTYSVDVPPEAQPYRTGALASPMRPPAFTGVVEDVEVYRPRKTNVKPGNQA